MEQSQGTVTIVYSSGTIEVPAEAVMRFVDAIGGFPGRTAYALLPAQRQGIWWLMSVDEPSTTFVLVDPFVAQPDYVLDLGETEKARLEVRDETDVIALVMVALPPDAAAQVTANFRAPIVFNLRQRLALQIVSREERWGIQMPISLASYPRNEEGLSLT
jgi:flagellar assembly factor FliW